MNTLRDSDNADLRLHRRRADDLADAFVTDLARQSVEPGSVVAFTAPNSPQMLAAVFGCVRAGYAPAVLSSSLTGSERTALIDELQPALVVDEHRCHEMVTPRREPSRAVHLSDRFHCRPIHFTSGTSGYPKAVWGGWLSPDDFSAVVRAEAQEWGFHMSDCHLVCSPFSHSAPLRFALFTLLAGGSVVVPPRFEAEQTAVLISSGEITTTFMAPTQLQRLLAHAPPPSSALRLLAHAGARCTEKVKLEAIELFGAEVITEFYGSTEGQFSVCRSSEWLERRGTVGRARSDRQLRVTNGQIWCKVPKHARFEYLGAPEKTSAAWDGDWFTVGDLGRLHEDGYLFLEGRRNDLIISGGVNIYPAEVERVISQVPGVLEVCVVGIDDSQWGERVIALIVGDASHDAVRSHLAVHLAPYKRPKDLVKVDAFPLTHSGKIDRPAVVQLANAYLREPRRP